MSDNTSGRARITSDMDHDRLVEKIAALVEVLKRLTHAGRLADIPAVVDRIDNLVSFLPEGATRKRAVAAVLSTRASVLAKQGNLDEAVGTFDDSIALSEEAEQHDDSYRALLEKGLYLSDFKRLAQALETLRAAEELDRRFAVEPVPEQKYRLQVSIVKTLIALDRPRDIIAQIDSALRWIPSTACKPLAFLLLQLGNYRLFLDKHDEALDAYQRGITVCAEYQDEPMRYRLVGRAAMASHHKWRATDDRNAAAQSVQFGTQAVCGLVEVDDLPEAIHQVRWFVQALQEQDRAAEAVRQCRFGADLAARIGSAPDAFALTAHAGFLASTHLGDNGLAARMYREAQRWEAAASPVDRQRVVEALAMIEMAAGHQAELPAEGRW